MVGKRRKGVKKITVTVEPNSFLLEGEVEGALQKAGWIEDEVSGFLESRSWGSTIMTFYKER